MDFDLYFIFVLGKFDNKIELNIGSCNYFLLDVF